MREKPAIFDPGFRRVRNRAVKISERMMRLAYRHTARCTWTPPFFSPLYRIGRRRAGRTRHSPTIHGPQSSDRAGGSNPWRRRRLFCGIRIAAWPALIIVGFADSVEMGAFLVASERVDASSAAASANEIDARAIDLSKKAHFI